MLKMLDRYKKENDCLKKLASEQNVLMLAMSTCLLATEKNVATIGIEK